jgi:hypothetical protein
MARQIVLSGVSSRTMVGLFAAVIMLRDNSRQLKSMTIFLRQIIKSGEFKR